MDRVASVTEYAWAFRYPGDLPDPTVAEAQEARTLAQEVFDATLDRLPADVRSQHWF